MERKKLVLKQEKQLRQKIWQQHIDDGSLNTQYISTTKNSSTAEFYAQPNPRRGKMDKSTIIAIDTDKLDASKVFDVSSGGIHKQKLS
jgi:hypothetical protein